MMFVRYMVVAILAVLVASVTARDTYRTRTYSRPAPVHYPPAPQYHTYQREAPVSYAPQQPRYEETRYEPTPYDFAYKTVGGGPVASYGGDGYDRGYGHLNLEFGHAESSDGYGKTEGKYFVELPDGRLQTVEYIVDGDSGYMAKVTHTQGHNDRAYRA